MCKNLDVKKLISKPQNNRASLDGLLCEFKEALIGLQVFSS